MRAVDFRPIPDTSGFISENGVELVVTEGDFAAIRKLCTVTNKSALFQAKRLRHTIAKFEGTIEQLNKEFGEGTVRANKLFDLLEEKHRELREVEARIKQEYWADKEDGTLSLPAGFWWICENIRGAAHMNGDVAYREAPVVDGKAPRPYQVEAVEALLKYKRASLVMPTGTGKSLMIAMLAHSLVVNGKRVCIIEPTIELVDQTLQFLKKYFAKISAVGGVFRFRPGSEVVVSTIDSAMKHIDIFDAVLVDEFHHSAAATYSDTLFMALSARYFYGFTACSVRADGMSLGIHAACGPIVYERSTRWAIENGFLVRPKIVVVEIGGLGQYDKRESHVSVYRRIMRHPKVLRVIYDLTARSLDRGKKTMDLFKTVKAGAELRKVADKNGLTFDVASAAFRKPLRDFRVDQTKLLVSNSALCGEGVDIPNIDAVINCCQVSSENMVRQIIGRGLRISPNKDELVYVDIVTKGFEPFERAAYNRMRIYRDISDNIQMVAV